MKGLYRRKNSSFYWMNFTANGQSYQRSTGTSDKALAEKILQRVNAEIIAGVWFDRKEEKVEQHAFSELAEKYKAWIQCRYKAIQFKEVMIKQLTDRFGDEPLNNFSTHMLEQLQSDRLKAGVRKFKKGKEFIDAPNKPSTVNRLLAVLSHMFTKAVDWKMMDKTVKDSLNVKMLPEHNKRLRYLSREESQALINACVGMIKFVVIVALNTGMRKSEILNLMWSQVDLKHGFILLDKTKNGERREIPINSVLLETLQGIVRRIDVPYVFCNPETGRPFTKDWKKTFHTALKKAGIYDFKFHDLRHTFASQLVMAGVDLVTVKELLGHKDIKMTLRYAHLAPSHKVKAVEMLAQEGQNSYSFLTVKDERKASTA
ncbi:MAG: site-specific integrase [Nitrospirae bacterium]|nr:site-specific integrase [Nitrospirota bacterium]